MWQPPYCPPRPCVNAPAEKLPLANPFLNELCVALQDGFKKWLRQMEESKEEVLEEEEGAADDEEGKGEPQQQQKKGADNPNKRAGEQLESGKYGSVEAYGFWQLTAGMRHVDGGRAFVSM